MNDARPSKRLRQMRATPLISGLALAAAGALFALSAEAGEVYQWVDEDGVVHITNRPPPGKLANAKKKASRPAKAKSAPRLTHPRDPKYEEHIEEAAEYYKVPAALVKAVIAAESNFDPGAVSHKGAMGLMQLIAPTAEEMYVTDPYDPRQNIHGGVRYLRYLANLFEGDLVKVIAAYNAGPERVIKAGGVPRIAETEQYVKRVLRFYYAYKGSS